MAVREWARISVPVAAVVHEVDDVRIRTLRRNSPGWGCGPKEAEIRARCSTTIRSLLLAGRRRRHAHPREHNLPIYWACCAATVTSRRQRPRHAGAGDGADMLAEASAASRAVAPLGEPIHA